MKFQFHHDQIGWSDAVNEMEDSRKETKSDRQNNGQRRREHVQKGQIAGLKTFNGEECRAEIKNSVWRDNDKDIAMLLKGKKKRKMEPRKQRNYLKRMNLPDARTWFRYRSKMTKRVKGNTSSAFRNNMDCIH